MKRSGDRMFDIMNVGCVLSNELLGLTEYYDAVLSRSGLVKKECEFRTHKLSMILDFIRSIRIPENPKIELTAAIIDAWRLQVPEKALIQREDELKEVMESIWSIKNLAKRMQRCKNQITQSQLNYKVLSGLPIALSDFRQEDAARVYDMLHQILRCYPI
jgi:hypothetical protein